MADDSGNAMLLQLLLDSETSSSHSTSSSDRSDDEETDIVVPLVALILQRRHSNYCHHRRRRRQAASSHWPYELDSKRCRRSCSPSSYESESESSSSSELDFNLQDAKFQSKYKIKASTFQLLCEHMLSTKFVRPDVDRRTLQEDLLVALSFYTSQKSLMTIAQECGTTKSSASTCISNMTAWLASMKTKFVVWPTAKERTKRVLTGFARNNGMSNVIGAIGGFRIPIRQKAETTPDSIIIVQGTVDDRGSFTDVHCGGAGVSHDAAVLCSSALYERASNASDVMFPDDAVILCDGAVYPSFSWLLPPFVDNGSLDERQARFNEVHARTRSVVVHAFERLTGRFPRLNFVRHGDLATFDDLVAACCVLHNVCDENADDVDMELSSPSGSGRKGSGCQ